jgi:DNA repair exonuclease SbcCD ATPase subunit
VIKYKELRWSHCFSYGADNVVRFDSAPITQIIGKNGHGKSSIALILEEVLYNKNSKGIKKSAILNRNGSSKQYQISLTLEKDGDFYQIDTVRGSTQRVTLYKNGEDISSHTATATFKSIEDLIGYDHKTFSQIVYQSSTQSLEFLTATDTSRKKFLIDLLNLGRYTRALEIFKEEASVAAKELAVAEGKIAQANQLLAKYSGESLEKVGEVEVPLPLDQEAAELEQLKVSILNIAQENKKRTQNRQYKQLRDQVVLYPAPTDQISQADVDRLRADIAVLKSKISSAEATVVKLRNTKDKCPTCGAGLGVDHSHIQEIISSTLAEIAGYKLELKELETKLASSIQLQQEWTRAQESHQLYEKYHTLYSQDIPDELLDIDVLNKKQSDLQKQIAERNKSIESAKAFNASAAIKNARIDMIRQHREELTQELTRQEADRVRLATRAANLSVLVKAFGTSGLVAYKIECLVKELEELANEYLLEMADGRFQLSFQINSSDKLNVVITDNGEDVEIAALSSGERARVNIATLLGIRKLMQGLSNTRTNLLILDETVENLDAEGKEKLIEILVAEEDLNTFLISHGFSHPLLEKLNVVKESNQSRIEK